MYLKKVSPFRLESGSFEDLANLVSSIPFLPTRPTQPQSSGFAPVLQGVNEATVLTIGDFQLVRYVIETRKVPASALREESEARTKAKEDESGRPLSREEKAAIKDAVFLEMIQGIPPTRTGFFVAIGKGLFLPFTTNAGHIAAVIGDLREKMEGVLRVIPLLTGIEGLLTHWLSSDADSIPKGIALGHSAKFSGSDGDKASLANVTLPCPESTALLHMPSRVTELGLQSDHLTFSLNEKGALTGFKATDLLDNEINDNGDSEDMAHHISASLTIELNAIHQAITSIERAIPRDPS